MCNHPLGDAAHGAGCARATLQRLAGGELPRWSAVAPRLVARQLAAKETVFRAGERHPYVYFVGSGLLKLVYGTEDGHEWVKGFTAPGGFVASISALQP